MENFKGMNTEEIINHFFDENGITILDLPEELQEEKPNQEIIYDWKGNVEDETK